MPRGALVLAAIAAACGTPGCGRGGTGRSAQEGPDGETNGSPAVRSPLRFTDIAAAAGLDATHEDGAEGDWQAPEILGSGCALFDADGDGDLDAYLVNAGRHPVRSRNRLFVQEDPGTGSGGRRVPEFRDATEESGAGDAGFGMGVAVGDVDGDGRPDLHVANFGPDRLYLNRGGGEFEDVTERAGIDNPRWSASAAFADFDADGDLDLWVTGYMRHPPVSHEPCIDAAGRTEYCGPGTHFPPERDTLWVNRGDGTFHDGSEEAGILGAPGNGLGVVCADFDRDGDLDVFVANDASANHLWLNDGTGRFAERAVERGCAFDRHGAAEAGMGVQAEDVDGDGAVDLLLTHLRGETNTLYRGDGAGRFEDVTYRTGLAGPSRPRTGFGVVLLDGDLDGDLDLVVANGRIRRGPHVDGAAQRSPRDLYAERDQVFEHVQAGATAGAGAWGLRFAERSGGAGEAFARPRLGRGMAAGDVDADGDVDLLITACGGRPRLLRNDSPQRGHWLLVRVRRQGGADAIGARVTVRAGERSWTRTVAPQASYLSSHDPRLHFGLGPATRADVEAAGPRGGRAARRGVAVDRAIELVLAPPEDGSSGATSARPSAGDEP